MKITQIETLCLSRLHEPERQWTTARSRTMKADCAIGVISTDEGLEGIGEAGAYGVPGRIRAWVGWLGPELIGRAPMRVMYEGLCLATEAVASRLAETLGAPYLDIGASLNHGHTHIIAGNRLRLAQAGKAKQLAYDHRWMMRREWLRPYTLMPMVRRYNEQCLRELGYAA